MSTNYTFIDLFSGCGGFSEGFYQTGFKPLLHVDYDKAACDTIRERLKFYDYDEKEINKSVICGDLTSDSTIEQINTLLDGKHIDVLVGGPPCQSFSSVGRAQDRYSMRNDPRNYLFKCYLQVLETHLPKIFVFENVSGLLSARPNGMHIFPEIIENMSRFYKVCDNKNIILLNSVNYGVPQIRKRVILIGVRNDLSLDPIDIYKSINKTHYSPSDEKNWERQNLKKYLTVKDAIEDLPKLSPGEGSEEIVFNSDRNSDYLSKLNFKKTNVLYNHVARKHNIKDQERYHLLSKHDWQLKDLVNVRPDLVHHDPKHFGNRYTVQSYNKPGKTIVAHLYKDGNLFIHPDPSQKRTFTVREAARIQSFPDNFKFIGSRTNQYKQVGNAVPPLMAKEIASSIKTHLECL